MEYGKKAIKYKGKVVFEKLNMPYFDRRKKEFVEEEACFMFVNVGEISLRSPSEFLSFSKGKGMLAKCVNSFFETNEKQKGTSDGLEVIGVYLFQSMLEDLFDYDLSQSNHTDSFNIKGIQIKGLLENFRESLPPSLMKALKSLL